MISCAPSIRQSFIFKLLKKKKKSERKDFFFVHCAVKKYKESEFKIENSNGNIMALKNNKLYQFVIGYLKLPSSIMKNLKSWLKTKSHTYRTLVKKLNCDNFIDPSH